MANDRKKEIAKALQSIKGSEVLAELGQIAPLPDIGIVAGQSVASVVMRRLGLSFGSPINDVDVFLPVNASARAGKMAETAKETRALCSLATHITRSAIMCANDDYFGMFKATTKEGYSILATAREGMLNEVAYTRTWLDPRVGEALSVLRGFDMNCVQVGVDAASGALAWTTSFEEFVASGQLLVANVNTPFHTAARYFKKKAELGCFGDDELNMAICALPSARGLFSSPNLLGMSDISSVAGRYGLKVHQQYAEQAERLSPWFKEVKAMDAPIWTMSPVFEGREEILERLRQAAKRETAQGMWRADIGQFLISNATAFCSSLLRPESKAAIDRRARLEAKMGKAGASQRTRYFLGGLAQLRGPEYFGGGELSDNSARALAGLLNAHPLLSEPISQLTLTQQGAAAVSLRDDERELGQKVYGWLEAPQRQGAGAHIETLLVDSVARRDFFANQRLEGERRLAAPLDLRAMSSLGVAVAKSLLKITFRELLTPNELDAEGREMRHCVGGYAHAIEAGNSRIFKIEGAASVDRSTLEVSLQSGSGAGRSAKQRQIRGFANSDPGGAALQAAEMTVNSYGKNRSGQLLAVAPAIMQALDASLIHPSKLRSARAIMAAALKEAQSQNGSRFANLAKHLAESLAKHVPQKTEEPSISRKHGMR